MRPNQLIQRLLTSAVTVGLVLIIVVSANLKAQTIHIDDLDYLVGKFGVRDSSGATVVDCSKFVDWFLAVPDSTGRRSFDRIKYTPPYSLWVYDWQRHSDQASKIRRCFAPSKLDSALATLRYFIMQDYSGSGMYRNVLTVWRTMGCDSLQYVCAQADSFETGIGHASVMMITLFPDNSILMIVDLRSQIFGRYGFFRSTDGFHFERFFVCDWSSGDDGDEFREAASLDLGHVGECNSSDFHFQFWKQYVHSPFLEQWTVDSARVQFLDLWQLAREHFGLESVPATPIK